MGLFCCFLSPRELCKQGVSGRCGPLPEGFATPASGLSSPGPGIAVTSGTPTSLGAEHGDHPSHGTEATGAWRRRPAAGAGCGLLLSPPSTRAFLPRRWMSGSPCWGHTHNPTSNNGDLQEGQGEENLRPRHALSLPWALFPSVSYLSRPKCLDWQAALLGAHPPRSTRLARSRAGVALLPLPVSQSRPE